MPKFVIERQYLLPIYQRLIIDAPDIATACQVAVENDDWESAEEDGDGSGATTITAAREIPEGPIEQIERGDLHSGSFLREGPPRIWAAAQDPGAIYRRRISHRAPSAAVGGLAASEPSGHRDRAGNPARTDLRCSARPPSEFCHARGARHCASLIPAPAPTSTASHPARRSVWGLRRQERAPRPS
jgi:hypothetical protein